MRLLRKNKKDKDENAIDASDEADAQEDSDEEEDPPKKKTIKKSSKKNSDSSEEVNDFLYVCIKNEKDSLCKCDVVDTLNCENQDLTETDVFVRHDGSFTAKYVNFKNNDIKKLEYRAILPGMDYEVEDLDFSNNKISKIEDKSFDAFENLSKLHLSSNRLKTISNGYLTKKVGKSLHQLFLDDNEIKKIPANAFVNLKNLTKLVLDGNIGLKLSKDIFPAALSNLEILSLDRCNISLEDLNDDVFQNLKNLKTLSLRNNPITAIPKAINAIPNLEALDLSGTEITEFNTDKITSDHNLTEIRVTNAKFLYTISECAFCGLPNLKIVDLSNNTQLYNINENAFGAIENKKDSKYVIATLKEFDINNCNFSALPEKLLDWTKIEKLNVYGNPFKCDCDLAWLVNDKNIHFDTNPKCAEPATLKGIVFSNVTNFVCEGKTSASSGSSSVMWAFVLFLTVVGLVGGFLLYTRRVRVTNVLYHPEVPQMGYSNLTTEQRHPNQHEDEEELQGDFHPRSDAIPV
uniref:LRRCT domain-containing protein n=1 Tax=Panagrolaimus davidi TaxID=227884 RepID=A0A914QP42_9BILA